MLTRRRFLELWHGLAATLAAAVALPPLLFWWRSSRPAGDPASDWVDAGRVRKIPEGDWVETTLELTRRDRWRVESARELIYVRRDGDDIAVLSAVCPHTGCLVRRQGEGFTCPCHKSYFDPEGRPRQGPSPRSLDPLEWRVEKRRLEVRYRRFRPGIAQRQELAG